MAGEAEELCVRARAAALILEGRVEEAVAELARYYGVPAPRVRVGLPRGCRRALGCYVPARRTIYLRSSSEYRDPFVVLHEFYHHLRSLLGRHRGTERHADRYAAESIEALERGVCALHEQGSHQHGGERQGDAPRHKR
ncbi:MAG: hypothetical protein LRS49_02850 [Desulfurococcales archaeon]|nr:hypothetical protein [Desulfurococcales archaeon]